MHPATRALLDQGSYLRDRAAVAGGTATSDGPITTTSAGPDGDVDVLVRCRRRPDLATDAVRAALDAAAASAQRRRVAVSVGCWTDLGRPPRAIAAAALGRGFRWGWSARWMRHGPDDAVPAAPTPAGIEVRAIDGVPDHVVSAIPFVDDAWRRLVDGLAARRAAGGPTATTQLGAFRGDELVGAVTVHRSEVDGTVGSALFDLGVAEDVRRRGIGTALVAAALHEARRVGAGTTTLNATPDGVGVYAAAGFRDVGRGRTWWLTPGTSTLDAPGASERTLIEAIAQDDPAAIDAIDDTTLAALGAAPLRCGLTAVRVGARTRSPLAVTRLVERGVPLDVLTALDLGWTDTADDLVRALGPAVDDLDATGATLLHHAVRRDDADLARALLAVGADRDVRDSEHDMTPAGWAKYLGRPQLLDLLSS